MTKNEALDLLKECIYNDDIEGCRLILEGISKEIKAAIPEEILEHAIRLAQLAGYDCMDGLI